MSFHIFRFSKILGTALQSRHRDLLILLFAALLGLGSSVAWYLYTTLLADDFTKPVTVRLVFASGVEDAELEQIEVTRMRFQPGFTAIPRAEQNAWHTPSGLTRDLRIFMPSAAVPQIRAVDVELGDKSFHWAPDDFTGDWRSKEAEEITRFTAPEDLRYGRSVIPRVSELRNMDFAALRRGIAITIGLTALLISLAFLPYALMGRITPIGFFGYPLLAFLLGRLDVPAEIAGAAFGALLFSVVVISAAYASLLERVANSEQKLLRNSTWIVLGLCAIAFAVNSSDALTTSAIRTDSAQNTAMAFNLSRYGVLSHSNPSAGQPPAPTNYREPFPPIVHAAYIGLHPGLSSAESVEELTERGQTARAAKGINVVWVLVVLGLTSMLAFKLTGSVPLSVLSMYLVYAFMASEKYMDGLPTELPAAALLLCSALAIIWAVERRLLAFFVLYGVSVGLLILTKAVFLYIGLVALPLVAGILWLGRRWSFQTAVLHIGVAAVVAVAVVLPWMVRNQHRVGNFELTERGPLVLLVRAHLSGMTDAEFEGSFFAYGSSGAQSILGPLQRLSESDLEAGGSLERLSRRANDEKDRRAERQGNPEEAVSYYRTARAERRKLTDDFRARGADEPGRLADEAIMERAVSMILSNPMGHLRTSLSFAWRGIWAFDTSSPVGDLINFLSWAAFAVFVIRWLVKRRLALLASVVLPVGMLMFHAVATHNLSRYNGPLIPIFVVCFSLAVQVGLVYLDSRVASWLSRSFQAYPQGGTL